MDPSSSRGPAPAGPRIIVADPAWRRLVTCPERIVARAAAGAAATVVLTSDREVKRLNARHRGRNKPTNVLSFEATGPGMPGEILLAAGVVAREASAAGKRPADHLAHLVIHGLLHLAGHEHDGAGAARRMEMAESRALARLHRPNPWRRA
jgi:probable rRNA maturation factor